MIDTIVFDFGGVLIDWDPRYVYRSIFNNDTKMEWFLSNVCTNEWNLEQDRGLAFAEGVALLKDLFPEHSANIETFYYQWPQMLKGEIEESVKIFRQLKSRYNVYGLTNWSAETFPIAFDRFDFLKLMDGIVVSGTEKLIKPDKKIFQLLLDRYALTAEKCMFIDDSEKNVLAAKGVGLNGIHFKSPGQLMSALKDVGLLS